MTVLFWNLLIGNGAWWWLAALCLAFGALLFLNIVPPRMRQIA